ncbi:inositol hexakisphosphate and diphosphoinositol-pentakisphosphate kinase [Recurvomyces mirabilis]|uniref:Inositol hexakisphosphate and diphosphoinositol-pentakisphosphate kinase n=1 Tax=Recurvomyces mirabilis TaxID=574656 RepID=A0AAE0WJR0_9PEZI|nr:inositol hexakisphosphate and diphosphoinositol-pentakisphosphate kinase [Recurvomyces mirabilis]KAK5150937.1 inositol hexakisphosphate and diphosphoinositol-pentakisphosphate kinase [Recurvomyces mirabilis]
MAFTEPLTRTLSNESTRSSSHSHPLSAVSSSASLSKKARQAEMDSSGSFGEVERASISMPPPAPKPISRYSYQTSSRRGSRISDSHWLSPLHAEYAADDFVASSDDAMALPEDADAAVQGTLSGTIRRPSMESGRMSFSSLYGRGSTAPSSVAGGSEPDVAMRHELADRIRTAVHRDHVTTSMQNGSLSPSFSGGSLHNLATSAPAAAPISPPSGTTVRSTGGRTRGRTPGVSRRVSTSGQNSASPSADRSLASNPNRIGTIGICALDSKARSKPSRNILNRMLGKDNEFDVIIFGDKVILDESVENWPVCDFLISFFSDGFPLEKAIEYARLRKPFCVNDLPMQTILWDRRLCLRILDLMAVRTPKRLEISRDGGPVILSRDIAARANELTGLKLEGSDNGRGGGEAPPYDVHVEDDNDTLVVNGRKLTKPFVEKPVSGEDHNINIYYPKSQGGGGRRLFRKINNKSSEKDDKLEIPRAITEPEQSYVYEQFLKVENAEDVKAYTVGPDFCHAETRKSPVVDGIVKRNPNGKELRYVTSLRKEEQEAAAKIATGFGQRVCGFDMLRVGDKSYVIDVNGWSFVKDNNEYYDQCARIMKSMFIREKLRWERGPATPSEDSEGDVLGAGTPPRRSMTLGREKENARNSSEKARSGDGQAGHYNALKSVFGSRSFSQLRDSVSNAAHKVGHPHGARSPSGTTSPLTSPASMERQANLPLKRGPAMPSNIDEVLPPPAVNTSNGPSSQDTSSAETVLEGPVPTAREPEPMDLPAPAVKSQWKLKGMVAVIRHADRTPKQKFKFTFHTKPFVDLLKGHREEVLLVGEAALESVARAVEMAQKEGLEDKAKLATLANALRRKRGLVGTKVQIKPMFKKPKKEEKGTLGEGGEMAAVPAPAETPTTDATSTTAGKHQKRQDSISEVTLSRAAAADNNLVLDKLQLVMKWGGEPTHSARYQASDLGENMRNDLMLMNRDVISNTRIFTSSERRVTTSAQIFASAFLDQKDLDADPDLNGIRTRKDLLDDSNAAKDEMDKVKKRLKGLLRKGEKAPEQFAWPKDGTPEPYLVVRDVVDLMRFHRRVMGANFARLKGSEAVVALEKLKHPEKGAGGASSADGSGAAAQGPGCEGEAVQAKASEVQPRWCTGEDAELFRERWEKLFAEFVDAEKVDPSRISELYDTMKFDALHNRQFLEWVFTPRGGEDEDEAERMASEAGMPGLARTESKVAREEFWASHEAGVGVKEDDGKEGEAHVDGKQQARTDTMASGAKSSTLSDRAGIRRRSQELMNVVRPAIVFRESYFNLFTGDTSLPTSAAKHDARLDKLNKLYTLVKTLFDFIGPQEYGITEDEKLEIGLLTSLPLLKEIVKDLEEAQANEDARSFFYFTKESHIYTLLNCILCGGIRSKIARNAIPELDYLSQICFELYEAEDTEHPIDPEHPDQVYYNYSIRIAISPGCHTYDPLDVQLDSKHTIGRAPRRTLMPHTEWRVVLETLREKFERVDLPRSFTAVNLSEKMGGEGGGAESEGLVPKEEVKGIRHHRYVGRR